MKNFKQSYKELLDNVELSDYESNEIKNNIISKKKQKRFRPLFRLSYVLIIIAIVAFSIYGASRADAILKHHKIVAKDNKSLNESNKKSIYSNAILDIDINPKLFVEGEYYTYNEIEEKLNLKLLKSDFLDSKIFNLHNYKIKDNKVIFGAFNLVNKDKTKRELKDNFSIIINTKYSKELPEFYIAGVTTVEEYYIESLKTEAVLIRQRDYDYGFIFIELVYDNIAYEIELINVDYSSNYVYQLLESFTY